MAAIAVLLLGLVPLWATAVAGLTCDDVDCGLGYCVEQKSGKYQCICLSGYEGDRCERRVSIDRVVRNTKICDDVPCPNGGTCISLINEATGEAGVELGEAGGEAPTDSNGEPPVNIGESMLDCDVRGECFSCVCAPGFTGSLCSDEIEFECAVRNCSRCDANTGIICEACTAGFQLSNNECKCPVTGCSICDTNITSCDVCSTDGAEFDTVSLQCVVRDPTTDRTADEDYYIIMLIVIMVIAPAIAVVCCCCSILILATRHRNRKSAVDLTSVVKDKCRTIQSAPWNIPHAQAACIVNEYEIP